MEKSLQQKKEFLKYGSIFIFFIALHAYFCFSETKAKGYSVFNRTWGFDHIKYFDTAFIISFYGACFLFILPYTNQIISSAIHKATHSLHKLAFLKILFFILASIGFTFLFYSYKVKYFMLGDMNLRVAQTMKQDFLATEFITMKILFHGSNFLANFQYNPTQSFVIINTLAGGIYVFFTCLIANLLGQTGFRKIILFTAGISSGMMLVFCGYIEVYAIPISFSSIYIWLTLKYIKNKKYFFPALLCLALTIGSHLLCVALIPSLFIAWYYHNNQKISFISKLSNKTKLIGILICAFIAIVMAYKAQTSFVLPIKAPKENPKYLTLLSFTHIWEFINGQLISLGISFIALMTCLLVILRNKIKLNIEIYFFIAVTFCMMLLVFLANLHRGSCDWDILSFTAIGANILVVLLLETIFKQKQTIANYIIITILGFNVLNATCWITINHTEKSIAKIENMLKTDPAPYYTSKLPGIIQFCFMLKDNKLLKDLERVSLEACNSLYLQDPRGCSFYAETLVNQKRTNDAIKFYEQIIQKTPYIPQAYGFLIYEYQEKQQYEKMHKLIAVLFEAFKANPNVFLQTIPIDDLINMFNFLYSNLLNNNVNNIHSSQLQEIASVINNLNTYKTQNQPPAK